MPVLPNRPLQFVWKNCAVIKCFQILFYGIHLTKDATTFGFLCSKSAKTTSLRAIFVLKLPFSISKSESDSDRRLDKAEKNIANERWKLRAKWQKPISAVQNEFASAFFPHNSKLIILTALAARQAHSFQNNNHRRTIPLVSVASSSLFRSDRLKNPLVRSKTWTGEKKTHTLLKQTEELRLLNLSPIWKSSKGQNTFACLFIFYFIWVFWTFDKVCCLLWLRFLYKVCIL